MAAWKPQSEPAQCEDGRTREREALLGEIAAEAAATAQWTGRSAFSPRVMAALRRVPRHEFVRASDASVAYLNSALPIGHGQTISQPYIVALMTDLADIDAEDTVLEVGTGCGYQAAVLAEIAGRVYSFELERELSQQAGERLRRLGSEHVELRCGDGRMGWSEHAPYHAILVTAAGREIPPRLIEQLKPGGRMVIPVGEGYLGQNLILVEKDPEGRVSQREVLPVAFVALRSGESDPPARD